MEQNQRYPNTLKITRKQAGLRQTDVAKALGLVSTERISLWENGQTYPNIVNLFKLCRLYKTFPHEVYEELFMNPDAPVESDY